MQKLYYLQSETSEAICLLFIPAICLNKQPPTRDYSIFCFYVSAAASRACIF